MALVIRPGKLIGDGEEFQNAGTELEAFVEGTDISNIGRENFEQQNAPFVVSQTDPPSTFAHGMLWFKRGEGRMYNRFTRGPIQTELNVPVSNITDGGRYVADGSHWVCVSDRREVVAHHITDAPEHWTIPFGAVRLGGGTLQDGDLDYNTDTIHWASRVSRGVGYSGPVDLWGGGRVAFVGLRVEAWGQRPLSQKYFTHTTDFTLAPHHAYVGVFHDLGYRRIGAGSGVSNAGPYHGLVNGTVGVAGEYSALDAHHAAQRDDRVVHKTAAAGVVGYDTGYDDRTSYVGFVTESGPPKTTSPLATPRMLTFWFGASPIRNFSL